MQIIIEIPEEEYRCVQITGCIGNKTCISNAIYNGTPLPKGHGRLIDADKLVPDCREDFVYYDDDEHNVFTAVGIAQIECADTIIEADTESENKE